MYVLKRSFLNLHEQGYVFVEHYAGLGAMTSAIREQCGPSAKLDIDYHRGMNVCTAPGFLCKS